METTHLVTVSSNPLPGFETVEPKRTALLVIDLQNGFMLPDQPLFVPCAAGLPPVVNRSAAAMRQAGGLVVWTRHSWDDEGPARLPKWQQIFPFWSGIEQTCRPGTPGHALHAGLDVQAEDLVLDKYRFSAFLPNSSDLDTRLKSRGIDTLWITGTVTNGCCAFTARDAVQLDYRVTIVADGTATATDDAQNATLDALQNEAPLFEVMRADELIARLNG